MSQPKYSSEKSLAMFAGFMLTLLVAASVAMAQAPGTGTDAVSGKYEGTAKPAAAAAGATDVKLTLELKSESGKLTGSLATPQGPVEITEGSLTDGKLMLKFGAGAKDGILTGRLQDEKVVGDWIKGAQKHAVELKKVAASDVGASLSGEWTALADTQGGFPFSLTLKVEGEKVTGGSSSQLGESSISSGSWKDGKLIFVLDSANGPIAMSATVVDGKLVGDFDYAGQLQGKWVATKKAP